jgi:spore cortex biosynthesis protein YabQ
MSGQAIIFLLTVAFGLCVGLFFDCFRVLRRTLRHPWFLTQLEDILFWIAVSLAMFYIMLNENSGEIRFYSILGVFIGMVLYFETLSRLVLPVSVKIVRFIKSVIITVIKILLAPFRLLLYILSFPANFCKKIAKKYQNRTIVALRKIKNCVIIKTRIFKKELNIIRKKT